MLIKSQRHDLLSLVFLDGGQFAEETYSDLIASNKYWTLNFNLWKCKRIIQISYCV